HNHKNIKLTKPENSSKSTSTSRIKKSTADRRRSKCKKGDRIIRRIAFTCSFPASSLITLHLVHLFTWLYKQQADRQTAPDYRKPLYISLASVFWTSTLLLPPDYRSLPNPRILSPDSASPALTQFLSPDHRTLPSHWGCKPENLCDVLLPSAVHHTEEPKFSFLILPRSLKRGS
ncbi:hypothetical protein ATANTOWER_019551, partial [Ataeniobius toweri]|nr:hypothetical protein [Ataeniobius toweri]